MKFRAAILNEINKPLIVDTIKSNSLLEGQVLVKVEKSGICRSQIFEINGQRGKDDYLPHLLGHEALGYVIDIGENVSTLQKGDFVVLSWIQSKGINAEPAKYSWRGKVLNGGRVTTFSEYSVCSENRCTKISEKVAKLIGPSLGCALPTGYGLSLTFNEIKKAKFAAVVGLGGIGMSALTGIIQETNCKVICIDLEDVRLEYAKKLGADYIINPFRESNLKERIKDITKNKLLDVLFECSGSIKALNGTLDLINNNGIVKFVSHPKSGDVLKIDPFDLILGKKIEGSWGGGVKPEKHFELIAKKTSKNLEFLNLYSMKDYPLDNINDAINDLRNLKVLRPVIKM